MSDYRSEYNRKLVTPRDAVCCIRSGDWVDYGWATCMPRALDEALAERYAELTDVKLRSGMTLEEPAVMAVPDAQEHFTWCYWHGSGIDRKLSDQGIAYYIPMRYSELPGFYTRGLVKSDVVMLQTAPMDENGFFNFGLNCSHLKAVCDTAETVIIEVNNKMPWCYGGTDNAVHISDVDMIVEGDNRELAEIRSTNEASFEDRRVAEQVVAQIPDGACLQLGVGKMPNAIGSMIARSDLKHLGVHTEMFVDAFIDIAKVGKLDGSRKSINRGKQTYAFGAGSRRLYEYLDRNPDCMAAPVNYVNDARIISLLDNFISINSAVDVDLFGQISSESSGTRQISGAGGQLDFLLGAYLSKGGKSFICLTSTYTGKDGMLRSRIRPTLSEGTIVTDTRANPQYLVTEFGMISLKGLTTWERAEKIISIAHPSFRDALIKEAEKMKIWRGSNKR